MWKLFATLEGRTYRAEQKDPLYSARILLDRKRETAFRFRLSLSLFFSEIKRFVRQSIFVLSLSKTGINSHVYLIKLFQITTMVSLFLLWFILRPFHYLDYIALDCRVSDDNELERTWHEAVVT
jgi:hypothetical protein